MIRKLGHAASPPCDALPAYAGTQMPVPGADGQTATEGAVTWSV